MGLNPTDDIVDSKIRAFKLHHKKTFTFGQLAHVWYSMLQDLTDEDEILKRAFQFFDKDGNGEISVQELKTTMHELGDLLSEEEIAAFMAIMDVNNDGVIGYTEFLATLKTQAPELSGDNHRLKAALEGDRSVAGGLTRADARHYEDPGLALAGAGPSSPHDTLLAAAAALSPSAHDSPAGTYTGLAHQAPPQQQQPQGLSRRHHPELEEAAVHGGREGGSDGPGEGVGMPEPSMAAGIGEGKGAGGRGSGSGEGSAGGTGSGSPRLQASLREAQAAVASSAVATATATPLPPPSGMSARDGAALPPSSPPGVGATPLERSASNHSRSGDAGGAAGLRAPSALEPGPGSDGVASPASSHGDR
ncbi:hypothetical protein HXX76_013443 [Chlamydomonas incerta]|uniref:EF-hand domain-containing protein n=1 Tax=Chlamydomonas incerta TaxID=51695 RepID=A0A835VU06_CHLIN|nr:hypothetical protein HXX76_013443 [Chlamydomonas incerta]|eukprot:KAG2425818.1 hypothetical protein HXX76_013443 [Chlamydomonas incerta]